MGSLTVRNLSEEVKKRLRLRAAANGRSMEEEVRLLLAEGWRDVPVAARTESPFSMINAWMSRSGDAPVTAGTESNAKRARQSATPGPAVTARRILLIISGGIAAYKSLDLIRRLRERGIAVRVIMTRAAQEFVTPMSVGAIAGEKPFTDLFDQHSEFDVGH